ncbi:MAG: RluA family pseudouridine synthase [Patescibacteria group bacterium]|nr:RluA family pseudouridine synthase [Patescibacteria group bacterium]
MNILIIYEDENLIVINKPAGISVHPDGKSSEKTISDWFVDNYPEVKGVGEPMGDISRPGIVHRLDKETSGALILVKNQETFLCIKDQFMNHEIEKAYRAFVYGTVKDPKASLLTKKRGVINSPIGRSPKDIRMWTAGRGARSPREALTEYIVLGRFEKFSYLELYPKTGRTHQVRVHLRYINHSVVSDPLYSGKKEKALGFDRLALHAYSITFNLLNKDKVIVTAPLPDDFEKICGKYKDMIK